MQIQIGRWFLSINNLSMVIPNLCRIYFHIPEIFQMNLCSSAVNSLYIFLTQRSMVWRMQLMIIISYFGGNNNIFADCSMIRNIKNAGSWDISGSYVIIIVQPLILELKPLYVQSAKILLLPAIYKIIIVPSNYFLYCSF